MAAESLREVVGPVLLEILGSALTRDDVLRWAQTAWQRCQKFGQRAGQILARQAGERILSTIASQADTLGANGSES